MRLRRILDAYVPGTEQTESDLEVLLLDPCVLHDRPRPELQRRMTLPDGTNIRIDAYWPGVARELDGADHRGDIAFVEDRGRDLHLTALGLRPVRLTRTHLPVRARETAAALRQVISRGRVGTGVESRRR